MKRFLAALLLALAAPLALSAQICPYTTSTAPNPYQTARVHNAANLAALCDEMIVGALTLGGNPAMAASGVGFGTTGLLFEGLTANTAEGLLTAADVTADRTWTLPNNTGTIALVGDDGVGDVVGPASSTDNAVARWDTTTGKLLQNGVITHSDLGAIAGTATVAGNPAFLTTEYGAGTTGWIWEGSTADAIELLVTAADPASTDKTITFPNLTGNVGIVGTAQGNTGDFAISGRYASAVQTVTVADSGDGSAALGTVTPSSSYVEVDCGDTDGCTMTMSETGAVAGSVVTIVNISANVATFADTGGVSEAAGSFAAGIYDSISYRYASGVATWVEVSRSNN